MANLFSKTSRILVAVGVLSVGAFGAEAQSYDPPLSFTLTTRGVLSAKFKMPDAIEDPTQCNVSLYAKIISGDPVVDNIQRATRVKSKRGNDGFVVFTARQLPLVTPRIGEMSLHMAARVNCPNEAVQFDTRPFARKLVCVGGRVSKLQRWITALRQNVK